MTHTWVEIARHDTDAREKLMFLPVTYDEVPVEATRVPNASWLDVVDGLLALIDGYDTAQLGRGAKP